MLDGVGITAGAVIGQPLDHQETGAVRVFFGACDGPIGQLLGKRRIADGVGSQQADLGDALGDLGPVGPAEALEQLRGLDVLFLDALRHKPHPTHSTVERSTAIAEQLNARRTFFTHICHELPHARTEHSLPPHIRLAYDGLELVVEDPI